MNLTNDRFVFVSGAGLTIDWQGVKTKDLTDAVCNIESPHFFPYEPRDINNKVTTIGLFLKQHIENYYDDTSNINFETLLDFAESIYFYIKNKEHLEEEKSINLSYPVIFDLKPELENLFTLKEGYSENEIKTDDPFHLKSNYILSFIVDAIKKIVDLVLEYQNNINEESNTDKNNLLVQFLQSICKEKNVLRFYTLNYDNFIPTICKDFLDFFNGFSDISNNAKVDENIRAPDTQGILLDKIYEHSFYNLHGSIYFHNDAKSLNSNSNTFCFNENIGPIIGISNNAGTHYQDNLVNQNEEILNFPIITGLNKLQKSSKEPFNSFLMSFQLDCLSSNVIFIIGYSFSDMHLNGIIKNSIKASSKIIICIDKIDNNYINRINENQIYKTIKSYLLPNYDAKNESNHEKYLFFSYNDIKIFFFIDGIISFLETWDEFQKIIFKNNEI